MAKSQKYIENEGDFKIALHYGRNISTKYNSFETLNIHAHVNQAQKTLKYIFCVKKI